MIPILRLIYMFDLVYTYILVTAGGLHYITVL